MVQEPVEHADGGGWLGEEELLISKCQCEPSAERRALVVGDLKAEKELLVSSIGAAPISSIGGWARTSAVVDPPAHTLVGRVR